AEHDDPRRQRGRPVVRRAAGPRVPRLVTRAAAGPRRARRYARPVPRRGPRAPLAGVAVAAAAALVLARRRRGRAAGTAADGPGPAVRARSRAQRRAELARLGGRAGAGYALHRARRIFASAERQAELDQRFEMRTAEQVAEVLGNMKGAFMKIGQMASYPDVGLPDATRAAPAARARLFESLTPEQAAAPLGNMTGAFMTIAQMASYLAVGLPESTRAALAELQRDAPPMSAELAASVVERELGAPPEELFLEWDPVPLASASIGQVHRAITRHARAAAGKVRYPGVDE